MSVPDMIRNVTQRAKELPLHMLQTALSGMGQALLLGDRVRSKIKGTPGQEEEPEQTLDRPVETGGEQAEKPARRAPVIFAPRPEKAAEKTTTAGSNGARTTPEPVIFSPAKPKPKPAEPAAPEVKAETAETPATTPAPETAETGSAKAPAEETPATTPAPEAAKAPAVEETPAAEPKGTEAAEAPVTAPKKPKAAKAKAPDVETAVEAAESETASKSKATRTRKTAEPAPADTVVETPSAVKVEVTEVETAKPEDTDAAAVEVTGTRVATPEATEPLPGYAGLTVASLRARMRGRSAEQIQELLDYERATADRETVVRMYENRLAKLAAAE